ncbi:MAG: DUF2071 domain-containing protein [Candidatus Hydrogenedentota bacterium]
MKFLTAEWRNLILANYEVEEGVVAPLLPEGVELDTHDGPGTAQRYPKPERTRILWVGMLLLTYFVTYNLKS